jgi:hypothetical protein
MNREGTKNAKATIVREGVSSRPTRILRALRFFAVKKLLD